MNYTILYVLLTVLIVIALTYVAKVLREKNIVKQEDIQFAMVALGLTAEIIDELNLKQEDRIKSIVNIITLTMEYVKKTIGVADEAEAFNYAIKLCDQFNIEITPERYVIIQQLINISMDKLGLPDPVSFDVLPGADTSIPAGKLMIDGKEAKLETASISKAQPKQISDTAKNAQEPIK